MAIINASKCSAKELYHLMIQTIIPRPIAWVLTQNQDKSLNLAPFSYFNGVSSDPPILMLSVGKKRDGTRKDTWVNIEERSEFVVHISGLEDQTNVAASAAPLDYGDSEIKQLAIETRQTGDWTLPRIASSKVAFLCHKHRIIEVGNKPQALILGEIKSVWLEDTLVERKHNLFLIDESKLNPLARLGRDQYAAIRLLP